MGLSRGWKCRSVMSVEFVKAHAYGNDFLFIKEENLADPTQAAVWARAICDRHSGIGADGLIFYRRTAYGAAMKLFNADGSVAEVSGNGVRCLAAIVADDTPEEIVVDTDGGIKTLARLETTPPRSTFRAFMGEPHGLERRRINVEGERVDVVVLSVGNPQCIVLTPTLDATRFMRLGPALGTHESFPEGSNVEFVEVERPDRLRILIWERGVGPTTASGTGACALGGRSGRVRGSREDGRRCFTRRCAEGRVGGRRDLSHRLGGAHGAGSVVESTQVNSEVRTGFMTAPQL